MTSSHVIQILAMQGLSCAKLQKNLLCSFCNKIHSLKNKPTVIHKKNVKSVYDGWNKYRNLYCSTLNMYPHNSECYIKTANKI